METHSLTAQERFELFGDFLGSGYAAEAEQRWGGTAEWRQCKLRTAEYTLVDWQQVKAEADDIEQRLTAALLDGWAADSVPAMDLAEEHREHITGWFFDCGYPVHRGIGDLHVDDASHWHRYEGIRRGLATFIRDAIHANADRAGNAKGWKHTAGDA